jgi:hypothetical protein
VNIGGGVVSAFSRDLDVSSLLAHVEQQPDGAVAHLLENWVVPGERPHREGYLGLRLAVRSGYLNFYVRGQSVAKLGCKDGRLKIETHWKYHQGIERGEAGELPERLYESFKEGGLLALSRNDVVRWTKTASSYANAEKAFVDRLVSVNRNVVDLETALPGETAPRMDIAVVEDAGANMAVGFWEAKCINNPELRASTDHNPEDDTKGPRVLWQAKKYHDWLAHDARRADVSRAFKRTGQIMSKLSSSLIAFDQDRFGHLHKLDGRIERLGTHLPEIITKPGLVVGAYCPSSWLAHQPDSAKLKAEFAGKLRSYRAGKVNHEEKLRRHFAQYLCCEPGAKGGRLPELTA